MAKNAIPNTNQGFKYKYFGEFDLKYMLLDKLESK